MPRQLLDDLVGDDFAIAYSVISNPRALHRALCGHQQVKEIRLALSRGELTEHSLQAFATELLREFEFGKRFPHEIALAALAVALEKRPTVFAEEFIRDLSRLDCAELPVAIRVAKQASLARGRLAGNRTKHVRWPDEAGGSADWQPAPQPCPVAVGQQSEFFVFESL